MMQTSTPHPWKRTLALVAITQAIMSLSVSLSWPFLPLYVVELGVREPSTASMWAGIITAPQFLLAALVSPFWGAFADRVGRKAMVLRAALSMAAFTFLMGVAQNVWELLALSFLYGIFSGFNGTATALVGTQVPEERLGFALGWLSTAQLAGTLSGPLVGGLLADAFHDYREVYFCTSLGGFIAVSIAMFFVREIRPQKSKAAGDDRPRAPKSNVFQALYQQSALAPMFLVLLLANVCASAVSPIIAPFTRSLLPSGAHWVGTAAGAAIAVAGVAGLISAPLLGRNADRIGYRGTLLLSIAGAAAFTLPQAFAGSIWWFIVLRSGVGVFLGGIVPIANAWIGRLFPREHRGQVYGMTAAASSLGNFFGPLTGGFVAQAYGFGAVFIVVASLMIANLLWVGLATRTRPLVTP